MVLSSCCGVGSLRTGTLIIGALNLVLALLVLPLGVWCASDPSGVAKLYLDQTKPGWRNEVSASYQRLQAPAGPHFNIESEKDIEASIVDAVASWIYIYGVAFLIGSILSTVKSALLIHGARKENVSYMKVWVALTEIGLFLNILHAVRSLVGDLSKSKPELPDLTDTLAFVIYLVVMIYLIMVVVSYKTEIESRSNAKSLPFQVVPKVAASAPAVDIASLRREWKKANVSDFKYQPFK